MQIEIAFLLWDAASRSSPSTGQAAPYDDAILTTQASGRI